MNVITSSLGMNAVCMALIVYFFCLLSTVLVPYDFLTLLSSVLIVDLLRIPGRA